MPPPLLQLEWCAPFSGVVRTALHELKYSGEQRLAGPLGAAIARRWRRVGAGGDILVPVPVHADRRGGAATTRRSCSPAPRASELNLPYAPILERSRATIAQFDLDRSEQGHECRRSLPPGARPGRRSVDRPLAGRWIILIDDVVTTGASLAACAVPLLDAGALGVSAITVARER